MEENAVTEKIGKNIDTMIGYLRLIKEEVNRGTPERIDALDMLSFVNIGLDATYKEIKSHFHLKEDDEAA